MFKFLLLGAFIPWFFRAVYWSVKMTPKYTCTYLMGGKGSGKSVTLASKAHKWKGCVYAPSPDIYNGNDRPKNYGAVHYFSISEWIEGGCPPFPRGSFVILDEMGLVANSRDFSKMPRQLTEYFKYIRKIKNKVYIVSQRPDVDKSIRDLCDNIYMSQRFLCYSIQWRLKPILGTQVVVDAKGNRNREVIDGYEKVRGIPRIVYLPKYFKLMTTESTDLYGTGGEWWLKYSDKYKGKDFAGNSFDNI